MTAATIFRLGPLSLTLTGVMCALGLALLVLISALLRDSAREISKKRLNGCLVFAIPAAFLLGRAAYCLCGSESFAGRLLAVLALHAGGYSFMAVTAGLALAALAYAHVYDLKKDLLLDLLTPGILVFFLLIRFSEIAPAQSTGQVVTARFLSGTFLTAADRYGNIRHAVSRMEALAALTVLLACAAYYLRARQTGAEPPLGERFFLASAALSALVMPIEALRDGLFPAVIGISLDMIACGFTLIALVAVTCAQLWKTNVARQYILLRAVPSVVLTLTALWLSRRAPALPSPELNSFYILLCSLAVAFLLHSLRAARLRRVRAKEAAEHAFVVRIPPANPLPGGIAEEVPVESATDFAARLAAEKESGEPATETETSGGQES